MRSGATAKPGSGSKFLRPEPGRGAATRMRCDLSSLQFAISYTVKDESRLLPSAIDYHIAAGCSRIYVFWDGTSDRADSLHSAYPSVVARNSITPGEIEDAPLWIKRILCAWETDMDVRKCINTYYAAKSAAIEGIDWLISLDPDELILMEKNGPINHDHISKHLRCVPDNVNQLLLPNLDSVPTSAESTNPFSDCVYFMNRFPVTEFIWRYSRALLIRISRSPALVAWYDYIFYQVRFAGALPRLMREPRSGRLIPAGYFLGYSSYKAFIRIRTFFNFTFGTHGWTRYVRSPRNMRLGNILHYDMPDGAYFAAKFQKRQEGIILKAFYLRYRLALVARNCSDSEIKEFFERYIAIRDPARIWRLAKKGILLKIDVVSNFMKSTHGGASLPESRFVAPGELGYTAREGNRETNATF